MGQRLSAIKDWFVAATHAVKMGHAVSMALRFCATMAFVNMIAATGWSMEASKYSKMPVLSPAEKLKILLVISVRAK